MWKLAHAGAVAVALSLALASCDGSDGPVAGSTSEAGPSSAGSVRPAEHAETIGVNWSGAGVRWPTEWRIGYGAGRQQFGIERFHDQEPIVPAAIAGLPGGSFAVVDPGHRRVVDVSADGVVGRTIVAVPQVASDVAWDQAHQRLVIIADESHGLLVEVPADGPPSTVEMGRPVARLTATDDGVYEGGPSQDDPFSPVPAPASGQAEAASDGIVLADRSALRLTSNQSGSRWTISRGDRWSLELAFVGRGGPEPVLSLVSDLVVTGDTLVTAALVGSFTTRPGLSRQLLVIRIGLEDGSLLGATHVRQCGLSQEENVVSRITLSPDGVIHQFCVGPHGVELRRGPAAR